MIVLASYSAIARRPRFTRQGLHPGPDRIEWQAHGMGRPGVIAWMDSSSSSVLTTMSRSERYSRAARSVVGGTEPIALVIAGRRSALDDLGHAAADIGP